MKKRACCFLTVLLTASLLCGCQSQNDLKAEYDFGDYFINFPTDGEQTETPVFAIDNTTPYQELITKEVDIHTFIQTFAQNHIGRGDVQAVALEIGLECLRKTDEGALYSVHKIKQGGLLYIFYEDRVSDADIAQKSIIRWFYVREKLSSADFESLTENKSTMADVIETDETEQIFENIYYADKENKNEIEGYFVSWHYLEDGILNLGYEIVEGELVLCIRQLASDFDLPDLGESEYYPYNARILDMDWVE